LVVLRPVDTEPIPLEADVDSESTLLLVVLRPVDREETPLDADVDSDVT
jgi:pilus assembly protein FimV